jgi:drug/metabolite transporter (DMT)-like permease
VFLLTLLAMLAFAGNSLLCRIALKQTGIDAASFTAIRIVSGAIALWLIVRLRAGPIDRSGSWGSALALFAYAAAFSFSYLTLTAATGALLLFGAVQVTMIGYGRWQGVRMSGRQAAGLAVALAGLVYLLLPGLSAPPLQGSVLMIGAGVAWGVYSLRAKGSGDPLRVTAGNFIRAVVPAVALSAALLPAASIDGRGVAYAIASGALASGVGYALWYSALVGLNVTRAATVQLSVPMIAALGGVAFLDEQLTVRLIVASVAILGGIAWVVTERRPA